MTVNSSHSRLAVGFVTLLLAGCGDSSSTRNSTKPDRMSGANSKQTLTIHIPEMSDRLRLD